jgi:hypothetical protein
MSNNESLDSVSVLDLEGQEVRLGSFWRDQSVVLVFVRHFG